MHIYKVTNLINGKIYIGQTIHEPQRRWQSHLNAARRTPRLRIQHAIRKYGEENFLFEVIDEASTQEELNKKEIYWIDKLKAIEEGYNLKPGGDCNPMNIPTIKEKHDAIMRSKEVREKISYSMKKVKAAGISEETRRKLSEAAMGNQKGKGKKRSIEAVIKTAEKNRKKVQAVDEQGNIYSFTSVKEAAEWWSNNGNNNKIITIMDNIKKSNEREAFIHHLKWKYIGRKRGDVDE